MTTRSSKLAAALKSRFGSPKALLRALGLDESLADVGKPSTGGGSSNDALMKMRDDIEGLLGKLGLSEGGIKAMLEVLDQHAPSADTKLPDDDDEHAGKVREIVGEDELQKARDYLIGLGLSPADADEALRLAAAGGNASDVLPLSGLRGGMGGAFGKTRPPGERFATDERSAAAAADFDRRFPNAITLGADYSPDRGRFRSARWPDDRRLAEYHKMFGGEHIAV